jgi:dTDP-4-dehydrorhamnose reductase
MSGPILVTGATGLLGPYIAEALAAIGPVVKSGARGGDLRCDLTDARATRDLIAQVRPRVVVHAAALSAVDECERDPARAFALNCHALRALVQALPPETRLIAISTDQVYPDTAGPHAEPATGPVNVYGASKLAGEAEALAHPGALVVRTNFFGPSRTPGRESLSDWIAASLAARRAIRLFRDSLFSPLHMATLCELMRTALEKGLSGVFNFGSRHGESKHAFALAVARHLGLPTQSATPGSMRDVPHRARRPVDMRLDLQRIETALGRPMPSLTEEIDKL